MPEAYIVAATRTAGGRKGGQLSGWHPVDLAAQVLDELVRRTGADPARIDEILDEAVLLPVVDARGRCVLHLEALALHALDSKSFSPARFWELMHAVELDFDALYSAYVGKNVLNFFRQDNGYKEGTYVKNWAGREDNEHLVDLVATLDHGAEDFADQVYKALESRYREVVSAA